MQSTRSVRCVRSSGGGVGLHAGRRAGGRPAVPPPGGRHQRQALRPRAATAPARRQCGAALLSHVGVAGQGRGARARGSQTQAVHAGLRLRPTRLPAPAPLPQGVTEVDYDASLEVERIREAVVPSTPAEAQVRARARARATDAGVRRRGGPARTESPRPARRSCQANSWAAAPLIERAPAPRPTPAPLRGPRPRPRPPRSSPPRSPPPRPRPAPRPRCGRSAASCARATGTTW
jgi:hypothetical protein